MVACLALMSGGRLRRMLTNLLPNLRRSFSKRRNGCAGTFGERGRSLSLYQQPTGSLQGRRP